MSYLKDREIWLSNVPTGNPPAGYFWKFIQNGKVVVRDSSGNDQMMVATSGSQAITGSLTVTEGITGTVSSASYVEYSNVANKPELVSGSAQIAEFGYATTGSNGFDGSQSITGSLTVTGQVVAQTLNVQQVTSSIVYSSGSNVFGNELGNTQQFTGSLQVTGSTHYLLGNVGIGTTSLVADALLPLQINAGASGQAYFASNNNGGYGLLMGYDNANGYARVRNVSNTALTFETNNSEKLRLDSTGNLGLGVTPSAWGTIKALQVFNGSFSGSPNNNIVYQFGNTYYDGSSFRYIASDFAAQYRLNNDGGHAWYIAPSGTAGNAISFTQAMTLDANGTMILGGTSTTGTAGTGSGRGNLILAGSTSNKLTFNNNSTTVNGYVYSDSSELQISAGAGFMNFYAGSSERMRITSDSNILVGTTSLRVTGFTTGTSQYAMENTGYGGAQWFTNRNDNEGSYIVIGKSRGTTVNSNTLVSNNDILGAVIFQGTDGTNSETAAWIRSSVDGTPGSNDMPGRLEFATTADGASSPTERMRITSGGSLQINYNPGGGDIYFRDTTNGAVMFYVIPATYVGTAPFNSNRFLAANSSHISFETGGAERMRIISTGEVGIGVVPVTQQSTWKYVQVGNLTLMGPTPATDKNGIIGANAYYNDGWKRIIGGYANFIELNQGEGNIRTYTSGTGTAGSALSLVEGPYILNGGVSWTNGSSDVRKKKNFEPSQGLAEVLQIEPVKYHFNWEEDSKPKRLGFKAQNLQTLIPEMVVETGEFAEDGSSYLTITPDYILPVLVKSIQEQQTLIESLKSRIEILEQ